MTENKIDLKDKSAKYDRLLHILIILSCICVLIQIYAIPHRISILVSVSNFILSISWIIYGFFDLVRRISPNGPTNSIKAAGIVFFSLISLAIGLTYDRSAFDLIGRLLGFFALPIMFFCISVTKVGDITRKTVLIANIVASIQYILLYFSGLRYAFDTEYGIQNIESVTLGFSNPNQAAIMMFFSFLLLLVSVFFFKNKVFRLFLIADMAFLAFIIFETDSRAAILLLAMLLVFVPISIKKSIPKIITEICTLVPFVYLFLVIFMGSFLSKFEVLGDSISTGRENIYARYFENLDFISLMFGDMAEFKFENLHNAYISIAASLGIVVLLLYYAFIRRALLDFYKGSNIPKYAVVAYCGLLCVMIYSSVEGAFFVGGSTYAALIAMMFIMLPSSKEGDIPS